MGPFKKGAFRIAMATGLPIVPIVIRNSDSVAGRNTYRLSPGTVDIAVLPPIDVRGWTDEELPKRIEQVRTRYPETLADWPANLKRWDAIMSAEPDLAELLADGTETVLLTQASTATEARLIRERIAAAGGQDLPQVSLGPPGSPATGLPESLLEGDQAARLIPLRVAWLPEEHAGRRAARLADMMPGHDPYHPERAAAAADPVPPAGPGHRARR